jgi:putative flippase GtrA
MERGPVRSSSLSSMSSWPAGDAAVGRQFWCFLVVGVGNTAISYVAGTGTVGAYLAAIPPVTVCMFLANRVWTFADRG